MKKFSYKKLKKLKEENKALLQELHTLIMTPDSIEAIDIQLKYTIHFGMENQIWSGQPNFSPTTVVVNPSKIDLITKEPAL